MITNHVVKLVTDRGETLTGFSRRADIPLNTLRNLTTGKSGAISFETLEKLCRTLGVQPGDILTFSEN